MQIRLCDWLVTSQDCT